MCFRRPHKIFALWGWDFGSQTVDGPDEDAIRARVLNGVV